MMMLSIAFLAAAQPLPPAKPVPYSVPDVGAVMTPIHRLFDALAARDPAIVAEVTLPEGLATSVETGPDGMPVRRHTKWADFAARLTGGTERLEERISDPAVEIDGDVAMVWAPYVFRIDGKLHHCGYDHFDLIRADGRWKILNITWSSRTRGCPAE
jgi:hypothetical protein